MSKRNQEEINKKISLALTKEKRIKNCPECGIEFVLRRKSSKYCSRVCSSKNVMKNLSEESREKLKQNALDRHARKDGIGFQERTKFKSSYPETLAEQFFENRKVPFERERKLGKWFADFLIYDLVLEVDGQQHKLPERKLKDLEKDAYLRDLGYRVVRVEWDGNHAKFFEQLENFARENLPQR